MGNAHGIAKAVADRLQGSGFAKQVDGPIFEREVPTFAVPFDLRFVEARGGGGVLKHRIQITGAGGDPDIVHQPAVGQDEIRLLPLIRGPQEGYVLNFL